MSKKTKKIVFQSGSDIGGILFLQTIYNYFYYGIAQEINNQSNANYSAVTAFMEPTNLCIIISVLFLIAVVITFFKATID